MSYKSGASTEARKASAANRLEQLLAEEDARIAEHTEEQRIDHEETPLTKATLIDFLKANLSLKLSFNNDDWDSYGTSPMVTCRVKLLLDDVVISEVSDDFKGGSR